MAARGRFAAYARGVTYVFAAGGQKTRILLLKIMNRRAVGYKDGCSTLRSVGNCQMG